MLTICKIYSELTWVQQVFGCLTVLGERYVSVVVTRVSDSLRPAFGLNYWPPHPFWRRPGLEFAGAAGRRPALQGCIEWSPPKTVKHPQCSAGVRPSRVSS